MFEYEVPVLFGMNITDVIKGHLGCDISGPGISSGGDIFKKNTVSGETVSFNR